MRSAEQKAAYMREYNARNRERINARQRAARMRDPEKYRAIQHQAYRRNRTQRLEHDRLYKISRTEHRRVAQEALGRPLAPREVVHHIDCNDQHNDQRNLDVMYQGDHRRAHASLYRLVAALMERGVVEYDRATHTYNLLAS